MGATREIGRPRRTIGQYSWTSEVKMKLSARSISWIVAIVLMVSFFPARSCRAGTAGEMSGITGFLCGL